MLFAKKMPEEKMEKMIKRNDWGELSQYVFDTKENKLALAKALAKSDSQQSIDLLLRLADDKDEDVVFATCETLRQVGDDHDTADLLTILQKLPQSETKLRDEISRTVAELHKRM